LKTFSKETIRMIFDYETPNGIITPVLFTCSREPELKIVVMPMKV
jgi:DNA polymerase III sliding clamp (beta) subunit (PCNA family)